MRNLLLGRNSRNKIIKHVVGSNNSIDFGSDFECGLFEINVYGSNNTIIIGNGCKFYRYNRLFVGGDNNSILIGNEVTFDQNVVIAVADGTNLSIGDDCMFANGARIRTSDQHKIFSSAGLLLNSPADVNIGKHVWLGNNAIIMKGVTIGDGCMVGMESMVTKSIDDNCLVVGTPAKVIQKEIRWER